MTHRPVAVVMGASAEIEGTSIALRTHREVP
jgi:hypothetical protein